MQAVTKGGQCWTPIGGQSSPPIDIFRGKLRRVWKLKPSERDNHLLDARIYNLALAEYLGLSSLTEDEWAALARLRGMPADAVRRTLFTDPGLVSPGETAPMREYPEPTVPAADLYARFAALNED